MFPGALNFDPTAKQPGRCRYRVKGCTNSAAYNYNSEASIDDDSCVMPVAGCSVNAAGYYGVDPATDGYQQRFIGLPFRSVGRVTFGGYGSVTNYVAGATEPGTCIPTVEGCMDPLAVNYDPKANTQSGTWCVPLLPGCMMPSTDAASPAYTAAPNGKFGLALHFDVGATVEPAQSPCKLEVLGCTDAAAINYASLATRDDGTCAPATSGCLNPAALNFGCSAHGPTNCSTPSLYAIAPASYQVPVTIHEASLCTFYHAPPSPPPAIPGTELMTLYTLDSKAIIAASPADVCQDSLSSAKALAALQKAVLVDYSCRLASTAFTVTAGFSSSAERDAALESPPSKAEIASAVGVAEADVLNVTAVSAGMVDWALSPPAPPPAAPPPYTLPLSATLGIAGVGAVLLCMLTVLFIICYRRRRAPVEAELPPLPAADANALVPAQSYSVAPASSTTVKQTL